jgi:hypothetical protein
MVNWASQLPRVRRTASAYCIFGFMPSAFRPPLSHPSRLLCKLSLQPRQDIAAALFASLIPNLPPSEDILTLEFPLSPAAVTGIAAVFGVIAASRRKDFVEAHKDIAQFAGKTSSGKSAGLPEAFEVLSESGEVTEAVLGVKGWRRLISEHPRVFRSLHLTDHPALAGW